MLIGRYDKRIEIQKYASNQNEYGEQERTWLTIRKCWAKALPSRGKEFFSARQYRTVPHVVADIDIVFSIRYFSTSHDVPDGITPDMRVLYKGLAYNIESIVNVQERNREIELYCSRVST